MAGKIKGRSKNSLLYMKGTESKILFEHCKSIYVSRVHTPTIAQTVI